jgi:hypothetical protein
VHFTEGGKGTRSEKYTINKIKGDFLHKNKYPPPHIIFFHLSNKSKKVITPSKIV